MISLKNKNGQHEINRVFAWYGAMILSIVFLKQAWSRELHWLDYIGFSCGLAVCYCPPLAVKIVRKVWPGGEPAAPVTATGTTTIQEEGS